ncbi:MAG: hypothetical protein CBARDMAM_4053 [uncultured Caballeronia sp.]|nr:MAG: hypothetical protein CBARDMAM_4053 [uncultured Caballeronia sp.]
MQDQRDHPVNGDAERLEFVVRSLLAHLIRVRSDEGRVSVSLSSGNGKVVLSFTLTDAMPLSTRREQDQAGSRHHVACGAHCARGCKPRPRSGAARDRET